VNKRWLQESTNSLGVDSPTLKLCCLNLWLPIFQWNALLVEKTVIVEFGESQCWLTVIFTIHEKNLVGNSMFEWNCILAYKKIKLPCQQSDVKIVKKWRRQS
jgi:hypothetical protein